MPASTLLPRLRIAFLCRKFYHFCVFIIISYGLLTPRRMSKLVEHVSKKAVPEHQKNIIFEVTAEDQTEEDVEIPYVMVKMNK